MARCNVDILVGGDLSTHYCKVDWNPSRPLQRAAGRECVIPARCWISPVADPRPVTMPQLAEFHLIWLTGACCDGCTIKALGDDVDGALGDLLAGRAPDLPRIVLHHRVLALEEGDAFLEGMRRAERGELEPYGLVVEASIAADDPATEGFYDGYGEEGGRPESVRNWLLRLAPRAAFVVAWGDCAVWGGPHALQPSPIGAEGALACLGIQYRSTLGLPVINLPGCAAPPALVPTLLALLRAAQGTAPAPALDLLGRPQEVYSGLWRGAFVAWRG